MLHLTAANFTDETSHSPLPVIVMFYASWCGKCAMMKPVIEEIERKYHRQIVFCDVDIDESPALAAEYEADIVPTFVFSQDGKILSSMQGIIDAGLFEQRMQESFPDLRPLVHHS